MKCILVFLAFELDPGGYLVCNKEDVCIMFNSASLFEFEGT